MNNKPRHAARHQQIPRVGRRGSWLSLSENIQRGIVEDEHVAARGYGCSASTEGTQWQRPFLCGLPNPHQEDGSKSWTPPPATNVLSDT